MRADTGERLMTELKTMSKNIKMRRMDLGISQAQLAKSSKLSQATVAHVEMGTKSPSLETMCALAKGLKLKTYQLLLPDLYSTSHQHFTSGGSND